MLLKKNCICLVLSVTHHIYSSLVLISNKRQFCRLKRRKMLSVAPKYNLVTSANRLEKITFSPLYGTEQMNSLIGFKGCTYLCSLRFWLQEQVIYLQASQAVSVTWLFCSHHARCWEWEFYFSLLSDSVCRSLLEHVRYLFDTYVSLPGLYKRFCSKGTHYLFCDSF